ncbi:MULTISPECIES: transcriptional repressor TraM [Rhizobium/Agrobacterium group]|uniref:Transcriptional repressor TraM n=1 Tax=Agrobacterium genomosp. 2 str. CFBP 5494 TaxID=1183436 RepID=A0A9W5B7M2_9HYPH|nr:MULTISPECIES: transcriptional repressor TraM [Rhizobium/Agrobacterium group]RSC21375.1 transcriptional regulator [Agrobacterium sp. FDAARGOS_525]CAD7054525.1 transcriptional regulator [Rhizobium sp. P007]CDN95458.1 Quorum sensing antiactivator protein [Agrobacterium tumefaciens]CUX03223.1 Transcriptional repressor TraM [Agrobacterium genomosp. 2 str. CFBP 5494]
MEPEDATVTDKLELRAVIGLTRGLPLADLEGLTVGAIHTHRNLVEKADQLFQALPEDYKSGAAVGGAQHIAYIEACMDMHAQMSVVNTLVDILGYIPKVCVN